MNWGATFETEEERGVRNEEASLEIWSLVPPHSSPSLRCAQGRNRVGSPATNREEEVVFRTTALYTGHRALTIAGFLTIAVGAMHLGITFLAYQIGRAHV